MFIKDLSLEELEKIISSFEEQTYRAKQVFYWIYKKMVGSYDEMNNVPLDLRNKLKEKFGFDCLKLTTEKQSKIDKTTKYLFRLADNQIIETVFIPHTNRNTICVSIQVGCKFHCSFCASGMLGFKRNLTAGEIIDQILQVEKYNSPNKINNVVFMGIGEPLDNYNNVLKAIRTINSPDALNIGARKITVSTCGLVPFIMKLANENLQIELSVSLHSADNATRNKLMPINKKYPIDLLLNTLMTYQKKTNRQITFEYLLINGINDSQAQVEKLIKITKHLDCKINLIRFNPVKETSFNPAIEENIKIFQGQLKDAGVKVTIRNSRGADIDAACGQLRLEHWMNNIL